ncbi:terminase small subunit [Lactobacillus helveticus]|uniref:Terminase n=1 Tax=Lactobacillus helveticus TaxID=1587 RepID=A0AAU8XST9_LACHE|nr:terminase small subunit [Lactobacillus helveticus]AUI73849.1 terminase [Lactobacillus helveticus]PXZ15140.1 terminase small subunit [Lactobacillus helveticus]PXZ16976.1 terminase small subunit [Lactobacillus helveticus]PXZ24238.1 terminase small subunit [Lactobacillus helveticus]PXZ27562.1 terminase small subunit [Lactobacillus helveticus]
MSKLTTKQQKFCNEYIKSGNAKDAATKAGYSPKTAYSIGNENLNKPELKAYIEKRLKQLESEKIAGAREVLEYLSSVMRGEQTESVATAKGVYNDIPVSAKDRISAAKELLKRYPTTDPMEKQKLKKLTADARISEARANVAERLGNEGDDKLDELMNKLISESDKK